MKVLHLIKTQTGAAWALKQIKVLKEYGVDVVVVLPKDRGSMAEKYREIDVKVIGCNLDFPTRNLLKLPQIIRNMRRIVEEQKPDIIHSHFVGCTYVMRLALGKNYPIPRVFQVPGPLHLEGGPYGWIDKKLAGFNDYWIGSCQWTCDKYISMGIPEEKVFKSFYGTSINLFKDNLKGKLRKELNIDNDIPLVGMVCYMYPPKTYLGQTVGLKGHEDFIKAIALLKKNMSNIKGVIIGNQWGNGNKYENKLRKMASELCGDSIIFLGYRNDINEIYPDLDVVVHPSLSENLGGAVESLISGVPTITTNIGGFPDIVKHGETGLLVPVKSPQKIAEALLYMLSNKDKTEEMSKKGKSLVAELLDVERTGKEVFQIYNKIINIDKA